MKKTKLEFYQDIFHYINLARFCSTYEIMGNYELATQIIKWTRPLTKGWELKAQSALLNWMEDNQETIDLITKK